MQSLAGGLGWKGAFFLEIAFGTIELRQLCEHEALAIAQLGVPAANALKNRLADIRAADHIGDVMAGAPRIAYVDGKQCYHFDLAEQCVLTVIANHAKERSIGSHQTDWLNVRRVKVTFIGK